MQGLELGKDMTCSLSRETTEMGFATRKTTILKEMAGLFASHWFPLCLVERCISQLTKRRGCGELLSFWSSNQPCSWVAGSCHLVPLSRSCPCKICAKSTVSLLAVANHELLRRDRNTCAAPGDPLQARERERESLFSHSMIACIPNGTCERSKLLGSLDLGCEASLSGDARGFEKCRKAHDSANPDSGKEDIEHRNLAHQNIFDETDGTHCSLCICICCQPCLDTRDQNGGFSLLST